MDSILFFDTEIDPKSGKILDIGAIIENGSSFHSNNVSAFISFLKGTAYICGHNVIKHDLKYIQNAVDKSQA